LIASSSILVLKENSKPAIGFGSLSTTSEFTDQQVGNSNKANSRLNVVVLVKYEQK